MSQELGELVVKNCTPEEFKNDVDIVFSGLDSDVAGDAGQSYRAPMLCGVQIAWMLTLVTRNGFSQSEYSGVFERQKLPP